MALANTDLFLVQDGSTSTNYKITFGNLTNELNSDYVNISGDAMTGNLTVGTNKITLNANNGGISGKSLNINSGAIILNSDGSIEGDLIDCGTY